MVENQDFTLMTGNDRTVVVTVLDSLGAVYDFTGHTLVWKMRDKTPDGTVILTKTTTLGITATALGIVSISLTAADTTLVSAGAHYHELVATKTATSTVETICTGMVTLLKSGVA